MTTPKPKLLIVTAAFGEGHNSAARNLGIAANNAGWDVKISDPCLEANPQTTSVIQYAYRTVTTRFPSIWHKIYKATDRYDFSKPSLPLMRGPERYLERLVQEFAPIAIVTTYPIYPYFLERYFQESGKRIPVFTVVTDSIEINASWLRAPTDHFFVTDQTTLETMRCWGIPEKKLVNTGFPVNPLFTELHTLPATNACEPFKVLYFATAKKPFVRRHGQAILNASPRVQLTIVMGKNFRLLQKKARELRAAYPGRVKLLGWTKKVPQLLTSHHLVIGKAGGATVHEAIAARCPMLIHHLVPGQEEGNLQLLQQLDAGDLTERSKDITHAIQSLLRDDCARWRKMKRNLAHLNKNDGALVAVSKIKEHLNDL